MPQGAQKWNFSYKSLQKVGLETTKFGMWKCAENFIYEILHQKIDHFWILFMFNFLGIKIFSRLITDMDGFPN